MMVTGLIDTHSHLQASAFDDDLAERVAEARRAGVADIVVCAGSRADWAKTARVARTFDLSYMLGIHPLYVPQSSEEDLEALDTALADAIDDPHFVGVGEIGLEGLVMPVDARQEVFFVGQLKLARRYDLPVSMHLRKSASRLLYHLRRHPVRGVVHAFNGSDAEREAFLKLGLMLGFGGAATYEGSLRIRRHLAEVPSDRWVLETDAPDMPSSRRRESGCLRTEPADLIGTVALAARLRGISPEEAAETSRHNALEAFPRLMRCVRRVD